MVMETSRAVTVGEAPAVAGEPSAGAVVGVEVESSSPQPTIHGTRAPAETRAAPLSIERRDMSRRVGSL